MGSDGDSGQGDGGGVFIVTTDLGVVVDTFTQTHVKGNHASTVDPNIDGTVRTS